MGGLERRGCWTGLGEGGLVMPASAHLWALLRVSLPVMKPTHPGPQCPHSAQLLQREAPPSQQPLPNTCVSSLQVTHSVSDSWGQRSACSRLVGEIKQRIRGNSCQRHATPVESAGAPSPRRRGKIFLLKLPQVLRILPHCRYFMFRSHFMFKSLSLPELKYLPFNFMYLVVSRIYFF